MSNNKKQQKEKGKPTQNKPNDNFDWQRAGKTSFIWLIIIFSAIYISGLLTDAGKKEIEIEYFILNPLEGLKIKRKFFSLHMVIILEQD